MTKSANTEATVRRLLEEACKRAQGIVFEIKTFKEVRQENILGAAITIGFQAEDGARNKFDMDIVYAIPTSSKQISSPIQGGEELCAATLENIIADKISACHRFGSGNTRMKDFDDLFRLSQTDLEIDWQTVRKLVKKDVPSLSLKANWINQETADSWRRHIAQYEGLPESLDILIVQINLWISATEKGKQQGGK